MEVSVWDTYVPRGDGKVMHFDILVPSTTMIRKLFLDMERNIWSPSPLKPENYPPTNAASVICNLRRKM